MSQASKQALKSIRKAARRAKLGKERAGKDEDAAALLQALGLVPDEGADAEDEDKEEAEAVEA